MTTRLLSTGFESLGQHTRRGLRRFLAGLGYFADLLVAPWCRQPALAAGLPVAMPGRLSVRQLLSILAAHGGIRRVGSHRRRGSPNKVYLDALEPRQLFSVFQIVGNKNPANANDFVLALSTDSPSIQSWSINWNDGSAPQTLTGGAPQADHLYADASDPLITVTADDGDGTHILSLIPASSSSLTAPVQGQYAFHISTDANGTAFLGNTNVTDPTVIGAALTWAQQQISSTGSPAFQQYDAQITIPAQGAYEFVLSPVSNPAQASGGGHSAEFSQNDGVEENGSTGSGGGVTRELWIGRAKFLFWDNLSRLGTPSQVDTTTDFSSTLGEYGPGYGNAVVDMRAYLTAPESGYYTFTINSDCGADLFLSTDGIPSDKQMIASFSGQSGAGQADSQYIYLNGGQVYYIESIQQDCGNGDPVSVGWDDTTYTYAGAPFPGTVSQQPISGNYLTPYAPASGITREVWAGQAPNDLVVYGDLREFGIGMPTPTQIDNPATFASNYGNSIVDMSGVLTAPETGYYTFTINSDYGGDLYLSPDSSPNDKQTIAFFDGQTNQTGRTQGQAQSAPVYLVGGQRYYIESVQEDCGYGDAVNVGWDDTEGGGHISEQAINGTWFNANGNGGAGSVDAPQNFTATSDGADGMTLTWNGDNTATFYALSRYGPNGVKTVTIEKDQGYNNSDDAYAYVDQSLQFGTSYSYTLTAYNCDGRSATKSAAASTQNPQVWITSSNSVYEGGTKTLTASSNINFARVTYRWDLNENNLFGETYGSRGNENGSSVTFSAAGLAYPGNYTVEVQASADGVTTTGTQTLSLQHVPPLLTISGPSVIGANNPYTLNLSGTELGSGTITSWTINWGDGTSLPINGNPSNATHSYAAGVTNPSISASASDGDGTYPATIAVTTDASLLVAGDPRVCSVLADQTNPGVRSTISLDGNTVRVGNTNYTSNIVIGLNGILYIGSNGGPSVYPLWRDWVSSGFDSAVLYSFENNGSGEELCVQWTNVQPEAGGTPATFQVILPLNTGTQNATPTLSYLSVPGADFAVTSYTWGTGAIGSSFGGNLPNSNQLWSAGTVSSLTLSAAYPLHVQVNATSTGLAVLPPTFSQNSSNTGYVNVSATDAMGTDLSYTWSVADDAPGAVIFADNADSTAGHTMATFAAPGTYHLYVTVSNLSGLSQTATSSIYIAQFACPVTVSTAQPAPSANGIQTFTATVDDLDGNPLAVQPAQSAFTWSVTSTNSGYSISNGVLHAGNSVGPYSVTASYCGATSVRDYFNATLAVAVSASAQTTSTSAALSVLGADALGGSDLTYTWTVTSGDPSQVSFEDNGDISAANTTADFSSAGNYTFRVVISDGTHTASSMVSLTVAQVQSSIQVVPQTAVPSPYGTQSFLAVAYDQFGYAMNGGAWQNNFSWEVDNPAFTITGNGSVGTLIAGSSASSYKVLAVANGMLSNIVPENQAISITTPPTASLNSSTHNATATLRVAANDSGGIASYTWAVSDTAPGSVSFSDNDDTTAGTLTATFSSAGTYQFLVTITDNNGLVTTASETVTVGQTFASITANSTASAPAANQRQLFTATAYDQFGVALKNQPTFSWSETGSGYSMNSGTLTATNSPSGNCTVSASVTGSGISAALLYYTQLPSVAVGASAIIDASSTSANLSVVATDVHGGSDLTYTWTVQVGDSSQVSFWDNGDTSAANTTVDFASAGSYTLKVTVSDSADSNTATSSVQVVISQWLTTIVTQPATSSDANLHWYGSQYVQQFTASGYDQFGNLMAVQPSSFSWSVVGNGNAYTIDGNGKLNTTATAGNYIVTASANNVGGSSVISEPLQLSENMTVSSVASANPYIDNNNDPVTSAALGVSANGLSDSTLTYTWSTTDNSPGVTFGDNGDSTAHNTSATFSAAGTYQFIVTITDDRGDTTTSVTAPITVRPHVASVAVAPNGPMSGGTQQFTATANDQFGNPMPTPQTFQWSVNNSGYSINNGRLTGSSSGNYTVSATDSGYSGAVTLASIFSLASATANADTSGTYATLTAMANDNDAGEDLIYTWQVIGGNANNVSFSDNGDSSAANTTASFAAAGTYQFMVTVSNAANTSYSLDTTVCTINDVMTSVVVSTANPVPTQTSQWQQFTASAYDQFGLIMARKPSLTWSVNSNGNYHIDPSTGSLTLNGTPGPYTVTLTASSVNNNGGLLSVNASMPLDSLAPVIAAGISQNEGTNDTTVNLAAQAADMSGSFESSDLTYSWSVGDDTSGEVDFSNNDSSNAYATTATFYSAGTYDICLTVSNDVGMSVDMNTTVIVAPAANSLKVTSTKYFTPVGGKDTFIAELDDQFGLPMAVPASDFSWSVEDTTNTGITFNGTTATVTSTGAVIGSYGVTAIYYGPTTDSTARSITTTANMQVELAPTSNSGTASSSTPILVAEENSDAEFSPNNTCVATASGAPSNISPTFIVASQPANGDVTISGNQVKYQPIPSFFGTDNFSIQITQIDGSTTTQTFDTEVLPQDPNYIVYVQSGAPARVDMNSYFANATALTFTLLSFTPAYPTTIFPDQPVVSLSSFTDGVATLSLTSATTACVFGQVGTMAISVTSPNGYSTVVNLSVCQTTHAGSFDFVPQPPVLSATLNTPSQDGEIYLGTDIGHEIKVESDAVVTVSFDGSTLSILGDNADVWVYCENVNPTIHWNEADGTDTLHVIAASDYQPDIDLPDSTVEIESAYGDWLGDVTANAVYGTILGSERGSVYAKTSLTDFTVGGDVRGTFSVTGGYANNVKIYGSLTGALIASDDITNTVINGDAAGTITSTGGSIFSLEVDGDVLGPIHAAGDICNGITIQGVLEAPVTSGGSISLSAASILRNINISAETGLSISFNNEWGRINGTLTTADGDLDISAPGGIVGGLGTGNGTLRAESKYGSISGNFSASGDISSLIAGKSLSGTITSTSGNIGTLTASLGINATATAHGSILAIDPGSGNLAGSLEAEGGNVADITCTNGSITADLAADAGNIGSLASSGDISGNIFAYGSIGNIVANTGNIGRNITSIKGTIGDIFAGHDLVGNILAEVGDIGKVVASGTIKGSISATLGSIESVSVENEIDGPICSDRGPLLVNCMGDIKGNVIAAGPVAILAMGGVAGEVETEMGDVDIQAGADVIGNIVAAGNVIVSAYGTIKVNALSHSGSISLTASGSITSNATASSVTVDPGSPQGSTLNGQPVEPKPGLDNQVAGSQYTTDWQKIPANFVEGLIADHLATRATSNPKIVVASDIVGTQVVTFVLQKYILTVPDRKHLFKEVPLYRLLRYETSGGSGHSLAQLQSILAKDRLQEKVWADNYAKIEDLNDEALDYQVAAGAISFGLHLVPFGAAVDNFAHGQITEGTISLLGDVAAVLTLGGTEIASAVFKAGGEAATLTGMALRMTGIAMDAALGSASLGQGVVALENGKSGEAAGYFGDAFLRLLGVAGGVLDELALARRFDTEPGMAGFWSAVSDKTASKIADEEGFITLEQWCKQKGISMPEWNPNDPASVYFWREASRAWAEGAQGEIKVILGPNVKSTSVWSTIEFPTLKRNPNVTRIIAIDPITRSQTVIFSR